MLKSRPTSLEKTILSELTSPPADPMFLFEAWLTEATATLERPNPNAFTLATVAADGQPSARVVLAKSLHPDGYLVFYTHYKSRKGRELANNARAAGTMHWDTLGRQIRFEGDVLPSPSEESDAYFRTRHWRSQLNALVSEQSEPLVAADQLEIRAQEIAASHGLDLADGGPATDFNFARPEDWGGYRFWFKAIEFWVSGIDRFHDRVRYERPLAYQEKSGPRAGGEWRQTLLQP